MDLVEDDADGKGELIHVHCEEADLMASMEVGSAHDDGVAKPESEKLWWRTLQRSPRLRQRLDL